VVTGAIFVVTVLVFRRGIWGTARRLLLRRRTPREQDSRDLTHDKQPADAPTPT
jgi:branched-chain amino acid transport system permease protein